MPLAFCSPSFCVVADALRPAWSHLQVDTIGIQQTSLESLSHPSMAAEANTSKLGQADKDHVLIVKLSLPNRINRLQAIANPAKNIPHHKSTAPGPEGSTKRSAEDTENYHILQSHRRKRPKRQHPESSSEPTSTRDMFPYHPQTTQQSNSVDDESINLKHDNFSREALEGQYGPEMKSLAEAAFPYGDPDTPVFVGHRTTPETKAAVRYLQMKSDILQDALKSLWEEALKQNRGKKEMASKLEEMKHHSTDVAAEDGNEEVRVGSNAPETT